MEESSESSGTPREQRQKRPYPGQRTLASFLLASMAPGAGVQTVSREALNKQLENKNKRPDGGTARVLQEVFVKALGIDDNLAKTMTTSALADIYQFRESGSARQYCVVFKLNRSDLCGHIFRNLSKLGNFQNPYGQRPLTISRNLSDEENKERQKCLAIKDILKGCGFDPKIKKNIFITVNGSEPRHYSVFLQSEGAEAASKRPRLDTESATGNTEVRDNVEQISGEEAGVSTSGSSQSKDRSVLGSDFPPLPKTQTESSNSKSDGLTPEQVTKFRALLDSVQLSSSA